MLDSALNLFAPENADYPRTYNVRITAKGPFGPLQPLEYTLNVNDYLGSSTRGTGTLRDVSKQIANLAKVVKPKP